MTTKNKSGQTLLEALVVTTMITALLSSVILLFAIGMYRTLLEIEMHESIICSLSKTSGQTTLEVRNLCIAKLKIKLAKFFSGIKLERVHFRNGRDSASVSVKILIFGRNFHAEKSLKIPLVTHKKDSRLFSY